MPHNFLQLFNSAVPVGTEMATTADNYIREGKEALDERLALEHYKPSSSGLIDSDAITAAGRHLPGFVRAVLCAPAADVIAAAHPISTIAPQLGCIAFSTDDLTFRIHNGTNWTTWTIASTSATSRYAFRAYASGTHNVSSPTLIQFDVEDWDLGTAYTTASYKFTAPVTGYYQIQAAVCVYCAATATVIDCAIYKNAAIWCYGPSSAGTGYLRCGVSDLVSLAATDYVQIYARCAPNQPLRAPTQDSYFSGYLIGT